MSKRACVFAQEEEVLSFNKQRTQQESSPL